MSEAPIACTLSAGAYKARMADIAELNRDALRGHQHEDLALVLTYAPEASARVHDMVRRERECCAFLEFEVVEASDAVRVRISAPEAARAAAQSMFAEFATGSTGASACGCC